MIAALRGEIAGFAGLTLNASNVVVPEAEGGGPPAGEFVALTVRGPALHDEATWLPGRAGPGFFATNGAALEAAGVRYAYVRNMGTHASLTIFLPRLA
jgi:hypothetical protein